MTRVTCHIMTVMAKMSDDEDANVFMLLYFCIFDV